jgi:hypothetical protein
MDTPFLKSYYRRKSTYLTSEQIETIRTLKRKVPKYRIIRDFHINENRVNDIWESHERQQQIIQSTISSEILPIPVILPENSNQIKSEVLLQSNGSSSLHLESTTLSNKEIKKRSSKSRSKSVLCNNELRSRISDPISNSNPILVNTDISAEKISSEDLDALYEREFKRDEKNKVNMTRLLATT